MFFLKYILQYLRRYYRVEEGLEYVEALRHLNRPSEVTVPNELIPAGVLMQLRGFMNLHVLSLHSDWVWPYWMERQSSPHSESFIPRAMNLTYINLTHRDWIGIGFLGGKNEAIVDPRGLVTPWNNGWSLDTWFYDGQRLHFPSQLDTAQVRQWRAHGLPWVFTEIRLATAILLFETFPIRVADMDFVVHQVLVRNPDLQHPLNGALIFSLRPANPEGISLVHELAYNSKGFWLVEKHLAVVLSNRPAKWLAFNHEQGDVAHRIVEEDGLLHVAHCPTGLCTGATFHPLSLPPGKTMSMHAVMPLEKIPPRLVCYEFLVPEHISSAKQRARELWETAMQEGVELELPDANLNECLRANRATLLLLHDRTEVTAGPFTYHRHWFRDAAFILNALDKLGYHKLCRDVLETYPARQWKNGYFCAQKGEWDSNGEAIWSMLEHYRLTRDERFLREMYPAIRRGALWIEHKRHDVSITKKKPRGLMPAGFSAEHLGPNDFYYWDNFWSLRGLQDAAMAARALGEHQDAEMFKTFAENYQRDLRDAISRDIEHSPAHVLPAAPGRPPDAGMIGNICAAYPLALYDIRTTPWLANTVRFIRNHLFHGEGFYQEMIHSGVNSYLTLQMAQCLLFLGDLGAFKLISYMLKLGNPTLCWPEAIHPRTGGGCMGDAHHGWAAAEWVLLLRSLVFVEKFDDLYLTPCVPQQWFAPGNEIKVRGAPTYFGRVDLHISAQDQTAELRLSPDWTYAPERIVWTLPCNIVGVDAEDPTGVVEQLTENCLWLRHHVARVSVRLDRRSEVTPRGEDFVPGLNDYGA
ncbi:MAG: hypothetical protein ACPL7D_03940 [Candidatus Sumerlaeaceae bacterium]